MKNFNLLVGLFFLLSSSISYSYERSDAFVVRMFDERVKVLAPKKRVDNVHLIIENRTLSDVIGRVENTNGMYRKFVKIHAGKVESLELSHNKTGKIFFVPMAPAFQEVELKWGKKSYEIPPKK